MAATMDSSLLALACSGSWQGLNSLLNGRTLNGSATTIGEPSLLDGVTAVEGDTALHAVATYGDGDGFLRSAAIIYGEAKGLLYVQNNKGDTPLHCAARAGNSRMVSCLVGFAKAEGRANELLETKNNLGETALHDAVRTGSSDIVELLMEEDLELANVTGDGASSPLYLAILAEDRVIAETLHTKSAGTLSYSGPNGQNALHAGVLRGEAITMMLLNWKKDLTKQADKNGSTPLHIAASISLSVLEIKRKRYWTLRRRFPWVLLKRRSGVPLEPLLRADPYQLYQPDRDGLYPIHIAASSGSYSTIKTMIAEYPEIAGLRDSNGRTFVHVLVEWERSDIVARACGTPSLAWIMNMRDNNGNTALHLAVQLGVHDSFCSLLMNKKVRLDLTNNNGETALDLARSKRTAGYFYGWNDVTLVDVALSCCHARHGYHLRYDQLEAQNISKHKSEDEARESDKLTSSTQIMVIGPVLIATVTFGALFTVPGGYNSGGKPTLAGMYVFDAFMMANTIAFLCSASATINLIYSGMAMVDVRIRCRHFSISAYCAFCSVTSLSATFALGAYLVLSSVAHMTAIAICALVFLVSLFGYTEHIRCVALVRAMHVRMGIKAILLFSWVIFERTLETYWPLVFIFGWAAIATKYGHKQMT